MARNLFLLALAVVMLLHVFENSSARVIDDGADGGQSRQSRQTRQTRQTRQSGIDRDLGDVFGGVFGGDLRSDLRGDFGGDFGGDITGDLGRDFGRNFGSLGFESSVALKTLYQCTFTYYGTRLTWQEADGACQDNGMTLAKPSNREQHARMIMKSSSRPDFWIGAHDFEHEGNWLWADHTHIDFTNWRWGQPDGEENQNCVQVNNEQMGKWEDADCDDRNPYVCQLCE